MEFLILLFEYIFINRKSFLKQVGACILVGFAIYYFANEQALTEHVASLHSNIMTTIGILTGFSISIFTVFLTIENSNIEEAKKESVGKKLYNKDISLYDSTLIELAYVIIIQGFLLIVNFLYPTFVDIQQTKNKVFFSIDIALTIYIIILLMKSVLDFYFIITKKKK